MKAKDIPIKVRKQICYVGKLGLDGRNGLPIHFQDMTVTQAAKAFGAIGGRAGRGASKRRSKAHYKRISALAIEARKKNLQLDLVDSKALTKKPKNSC